MIEGQRKVNKNSDGNSGNLEEFCLKNQPLVDFIMKIDDAEETRR